MPLRWYVERPAPSGQDGEEIVAADLVGFPLCAKKGCLAEIGVPQRRPKPRLFSKVSREYTLSSLEIVCGHSMSVGEMISTNSFASLRNRFIGLNYRIRSSRKSLG